MAGTGSAPWTGLTVGGVIAAGAVVLGLWFGGVFDPMRDVQEAAISDAPAQVVDQNAATGGSSDPSADAGASTAPAAEDAPATGAAVSGTTATASDAAQDTASSGTAEAPDAGASDAPEAPDAAGATDTADASGTAGQGETASTETASTETASTETASAEGGENAASDTAGVTDPSATDPAANDSATQETASDTAPASETTAEAATAPAEEAAADASAQTDSSATASQQPETSEGVTDPIGTDGTAPSFDIVRMESDGQALVAGVAAPGARVQVLVDGQVMGEETAGGDGKFVAFLDLPGSDASRVVTLQMLGVTGEIASPQEVILGPTAVAAAVAEPAPSVTDSGTAEGTVQTSAAAAGDTAVTPTVLLSDKDGVTVLQSPGAGPDGDVSVGSVSYAEGGAMQVSGRGTAGNVARAYLDGTLVSDTPIAADGSWRIALVDVAPGDHTLRIDEIDGTGAVLSRIETALSGDIPRPAEATQVAAATTTQPATASTAGVVNQVTVERGSTLWAIAREKYGEGLMYVRVFEANKGLIRNPDLIYPGQVFNLPD